MLTFIGFFLLIVILLGYSFYFQKLLAIEFAHALIFSFSTIIAVYFLAAIFNVLDYSIYLSFSIGLCLFAYIVVPFVKSNRAENVLELFSYDVIVFIAITFIYFCKIKTLATYAFWDEYSFWGILSKEINLYHGLRSDASQPTSMYPSAHAYLPSIFQYSITKIIGFKEAHTVFANGLMYIVFSSVLLMSKRFWWSLALPIIAIYPSLYDMVISLNSLHLDETVGLAFSCVLAIYIQSKNYPNSILGIILISPILFILPNIKEVGYWLAYAVILIIAIDKLINKNYKHLILVIALTILPFLSKLLWYYYAKTIMLEANFNTFLQVPFMSIFNIANLFIDSYVGQSHWHIIQLMLKQFLSYFDSKTMICTYLIVTASVTFVHLYDPKSLGRLILVLSTLVLLFCVYIIFRIELYMTRFSEEEIKTVASYARYFSAYTIAFSFCSLSFVKNIVDLGKFKKDWKFDHVFLYEFSQEKTEKGNYFQKSLGTYNLVCKFSCDDFLANIRDKNFLRIYMYPVFLIMFLIFGVSGYRKVRVEINKANPAYFVERRALIEDLRRQGLDEELNFKGYNLNMLDCYIYNYLISPYGGLNKIDKCLKDIAEQ